MKTLVKTCLAAGILAAASTHAATINVSVHDDAATAEADFLASLRTITAIENFNGIHPNDNGQMGSGNPQDSWVDTAPSYDTAVGTFTNASPGQMGRNDFPNNLMIESDETGEFGRSSLEGSIGAEDLWLDSNDAREVTWDLTGSFSGPSNAFGFWLSDASDVSADLTLRFEENGDQGWETITFEQTDGNLKYVTVTSDESIIGGTFTFDNSTSNDGWGIDNVTVGSLSEPGTLLLMGIGMLGLGAARRRAAK